MTTECNTWSFEFPALAGHMVTARFDGRTITSDAGGLLLREVEARTAFCGASPLALTTTAIRT